MSLSYGTVCAWLGVLCMIRVVSEQFVLCIWKMVYFECWLLHRNNCNRQPPDPQCQLLSAPTLSAFWPSTWTVVSSHPDLLYKQLLSAVFAYVYVFTALGDVIMHCWHCFRRGHSKVSMMLELTTVTCWDIDRLIIDHCFTSWNLNVFLTA